MNKSVISSISNQKAAWTLFIILLVLGFSHLYSSSWLGFKSLAGLDRRIDDLAHFPSTAEGIEFFADRIRQNPQDAVGLTLLGQLHLRQARENGNVDSYQRAEAALGRALELLPGYVPANLALATTYYAQHNFTQALDLAERLYRRDSRRTEALSVMGDAYLAIGQYQKAEAAYQELLGLGSTPPVLARLAHLAELHGRPEEAIELMHQAVDKALSNSMSREEIAWYQLRLGDLYFNTGDYKSAGRHFQTALQIFDGYYAALSALGKVHAAQGHYDDAVDFYQRAIDILPQPDSLTALGDVYTLTGQPEQARFQYETVELIGKLAAINRQIYNRQLANFYSDHDLRLDEALRLALEELKIRKDIYGYDAAAWAYYKNGMLPEAQRTMEQAMQLGTRDAELFYHAGMIAYAQGHLARAERLLSEALAINPQFDPLQARLAREAYDLIIARASK